MCKRVSGKPGLAKCGLYGSTEVLEVCETRTVKAGSCQRVERWPNPYVCCYDTNIPSAEESMTGKATAHPLHPALPSSDPADDPQRTQAVLAYGAYCTEQRRCDCGGWALCWLASRRRWKRAQQDCDLLGDDQGLLVGGRQIGALSIIRCKALGSGDVRSMDSGQTRLSGVTKMSTVYGCLVSARFGLEEVRRFRL